MAGIFSHNFTEEDVCEMRRLSRAGTTYREIALMFKCCQSTVWRHVHGRCGRGPAGKKRMPPTPILRRAIALRKKGNSWLDIATLLNVPNPNKLRRNANRWRLENERRTAGVPKTPTVHTHPRSRLAAQRE